MRKVVVALVVALLALSLAGCGGGGEEAPTTETPAEAPAAAPAAAATPDYSFAADRSADDSDIAPAAFPSFTTTVTPAVFQEKLDAKRPMLIYFYDDVQQVTGDSRVEVDAVMGEYRGLIDLVTFNVGESPNEADTLAAVTYARELKVPSTPYILVVDRGGYIIWRCKGFTERSVIKRQVEAATR